MAGSGDGPWKKACGKPTPHFLSRPFSFGQGQANLLSRKKPEPWEGGVKSRKKKTLQKLKGGESSRKKNGGDINISSWQWRKVLEGVPSPKERVGQEGRGKVKGGTTKFLKKVGKKGRAARLMRYILSSKCLLGALGGERTAKWGGGRCPRRARKENPFG